MTRAGNPEDSALEALARRVAAPARIPRSTYRVQLNAAFTFDDLRRLVPYLDALGVDTCYLSPCLAARPGSTHGYDIVDYGRLNPELGDREAFLAMAGALEQRGMGLMFDVVPNHMGLDPVHNQRWHDVLAHGQAAMSADWFDIDWQPAQAVLDNRVLQPVLGDQYGCVLERGELAVKYRDGRFVVAYFEHELPVDPADMSVVLGPVSASLAAASPTLPEADRQELAAIRTLADSLPPHTSTAPLDREARALRAQEVYERLAALTARSLTIHEAIGAVLTRLNGVPGVPSSFDALHALLERQPYRLAYWRTAFDEINYRRFFDIIELGAVRVEDPRVFEGSHRLLLDLVEAGAVTALRIDHPDGLHDPGGYFARLQDAVWQRRLDRAGVGADERAALNRWREARLAEDPGHASARPMYIAAEKVLMPGETLRADWAIHGGVGYAFLNQVNGLFVERSGLHQIDRLWRRLAGGGGFEGIAYECRSLIARTSLASEMNMLAHGVARVAAADRRTRDFTLNSLRKVLRDIVASFPVYRSYVTSAGASPWDREVIARAVAAARARGPVMEASIYDFVGRILAADVCKEPGEAGLAERQGAKADADVIDDGDAVRALALRFQQITGPIQAKGTEDTAFYRYCPLLAVNEVGSDPSSPSLSIEQFHQANRNRLANWPHAMLALSTHDTKRSGDARARLVALTERADEWRRAVSAWMRLNARHRALVDGQPAPDRTDEYHFYQALLAIWPMERPDAPVPPTASEDLRARVAAYMVKAVREAKIRSSWLRPDEAYEAAMDAFVRAVLTGAGSARFLARFVPVARSVAALGAVNALAQLAVQMAAPGMPDVYQGTELWHLRLVDPDNRQPVDFEDRRTRLETLTPALDALDAGDDALPWATVRELVARWEDGDVKLWVLAALLRYRRRHAEPFESGGYIALPASAPVVAFARHHETGTLLAIAAHHAGRLGKDRVWPGPGAWGEASLDLPPVLHGRLWRSVLTGRVFTPASEEGGRERIPLAGVLDPLPVAWLEAVSGA